MGMMLECAEYVIMGIIQHLVSLLLRLKTNCRREIFGVYEKEEDKSFYEGFCTIPAGDKAIRMPFDDRVLDHEQRWQVLVRNQGWYVYDGVCGVGEDPDYVSPIAAVGSYTNRGQDCSRR